MVAHNHNWAMISEASPGSAKPKITELFVHMAHASSDHGCLEVTDLKWPHNFNFDQAKWWDKGWFLGWVDVKCEKLGGS
jgi:hypothetical protein